jgi:hypothetical protein
VQAPGGARCKIRKLRPTAEQGRYSRLKTLRLGGRHASLWVRGLPDFRRDAKNCTRIGVSSFSVWQPASGPSLCATRV